MNEIGDKSSEASFETELQIERHAEQFEAQWRRGEQRPSIADFLNDAPTAHQARIFHTLLGLDVHYRKRTGESPVVETYLEQFPQYEDFIRTAFQRQDSCATASADRRPVIQEGPGSVVGSYKLREQIGEGGMGAVYVAEQQKPVRRKVALKIIKPGMDTQEVIARFEAERQALALMDHPNIAKVFDGGTTRSNRPYFVMELVSGIPVTEYCDQEKLPIPDRLQLFLQVCSAIQHAHQKGIIHRDVKPTNVLVTEHDGKPVPKVIDFGVAKAIGQRLTDRTIYTHHMQPVGTLLYMSPEQSRLSGLDIDTRSDVYALGLLLYELLTGALPFDRDKFTEADFDEKRRIIAEDDAPRPSVRVTTLSKSSTAVTQDRRTDAARLQRELRGELDWILMKALEKDRNRRYDSVGRLAADVKSQLDGDIVEARPPSTLYRLRKTWRKHRPLATSAMVGIAALLIGLLTSLWAYRQLHHQHRTLTQQKYLSDVNAAVLAYDENDVERALAILKGYIPTDSEPADYRGKEWYYLWKLCRRHENATTIKIDNWSFQDDFSPDRKRLVLTPFLQRVTVLNLETGEQTRLGDPLASRYDYTYADFSPDGRLLLFPANERRHVLVFEASQFEQLRTLEHDTGVDSAVFSPDSRFVIAAASDAIVASDLDSGDQRSLEIEAARINELAFSPDGKMLACGCSDGMLILLDWDAGQLTEAYRIKAHCLGINALAFAPEGDVILTGSDDTTIKMFDVDTGGEQAQLFAHRDDVRSIAFDPTDPNRFASAGRSDEWVLWDFEGRIAVAKMRGHSNGHVGGFSSDGRQFITEDGDEVKIWHNVDQYQDVIPVDNQVTDLAVTADGQIMACRIGHGRSASVEVRITQNGEVHATPWTSGVSSIALLADDLLFAGCDDGQVRTFSLKSRTRSQIREGRDDVATALSAYSDVGVDQGVLAVGTNMGAVEIWTTRGQLLPAWKQPRKPGHLGPIDDIAFSSNGNVVCTVGRDGVACIWNVSTGELIIKFEKHLDSIRAVAFSPTDTSRVATTGYDGRVLIWDAMTGAVESEFDGDADWMHDVTFLSDGKTIVTASGDGTIKFLDITIADKTNANAQRMRFFGHRDAALCVAVSGDDNVLVSGGRFDNSIHVWRAADESEVTDARKR